MARSCEHGITRPHRSRRSAATTTHRIGAIVASAMFLFAVSAAAQETGRGFLFEPPSGAITFQGGIARAGEGSDIFSFSREQLTLRKGDFQSFSLGVEYAYSVTERADLFALMNYSGASHASELREWEDQDGLPIEQTTTFTRVPFTVGLRYYPMKRGTSVGSYAWIPSTYTPYLSAGGGLVWYSFAQRGDFVDFQDNEIFSDRFESSGWSVTAHAGAGMDVSISPRLVLVGDARYMWGKASMGGDFSGFDRIDLSGMTASVGLRIRF